MKPEFAPVTGAVSQVLAYRDALERIAALAHVTQIRGALEDIGVLDALVSPDGWVIIDPRTKRGLVYAAQIAQAALTKE